MNLPDVRPLVGLELDDAAAGVTGIRGFCRPIHRRQLDSWGLWWALPLAYGVGYHYALRLSPGPGHGAVLRCMHGHAVTIASTPDRAIFAILAVERLLVGPKARDRLRDGWPQVRQRLRDAVTITGGDPDVLDVVIDMADDLPKWVSPAPVEDEESRREMLWRITGDDPAEHASIWSRASDSRSAPDDAAACLRLLEGNHGLDGTRSGAGLSPDSKSARGLLVACARRVRAAGVRPDEPWAAVIDALADRERPEARDFIATAVGVGPARAWDGLAAASFWFHALSGTVPEEHAAVAEEIAEAAGARHVLEARRLLG